MHAGDERSVQRQRERGKRTARERSSACSTRARFVELDAFVPHRSSDFGMRDRRPSATAWSPATARSTAARSVVFSQDFTVFGGSLGEAYAEKICKVMDLAVRIGCPLIGINDSGGARIQEGVVVARRLRRDLLAQRAGLGRRAADLARSWARAPAARSTRRRSPTSSSWSTGTVAHVHHRARGHQDGHRRGRRRSRSSAARRPTRTQSGVAHLVADDERRAARATRATCSRSCRRTTSRPRRSCDRRRPARPRRAELDTLIPDAPNKPYDIKTSSAAVVDDGDFFEIHEHYAQNIVCGFARIGGHAVGIVGNQPRPRRRARHRRVASRPRASCASATLQHPAGHVRRRARASCPAPPRSTAASSSTARSCSTRSAEATVPKITVITRKAYGGAYDVMSSKHIRADFNFAWPTRRDRGDGRRGRRQHRLPQARSTRPPTPRRGARELIDEYTRALREPVHGRRARLRRRLIRPRDTRRVLIAALETYSQQARRARRSASTATSRCDRLAGRGASRSRAART